MESEPMLTPGGKIPSTEKNSPQRRMEPTTLHQAGQLAQYATNGLFRSHFPEVTPTFPSRNFPYKLCLVVCWLFASRHSKQHDSVSRGRICSNKCTRCHTETEVADQTFCLTQSQYTSSSSSSSSSSSAFPSFISGVHYFGWDVCVCDRFLI